MEVLDNNPPRMSGAEARLTGKSGRMVRARRGWAMEGLERIGVTSTKKEVRRAAYLLLVRCVSLAPEWMGMGAARAAEDLERLMAKGAEGEDGAEDEEGGEVVADLERDRRRTMCNDECLLVPPPPPPPPMVQEEGRGSWGVSVALMVGRAVYPVGNRIGEGGGGGLVGVGMVRRVWFVRVISGRRRWSWVK